MLARLLLLFTIVPFIELALLLPLGEAIGLWPTLGLILVTAVLGAVLGKRAGLGAWRRIQGDLAHGRLPGDSMLDGLIVLVACTLLVTPGVLSDLTGLALLIPPLRSPVRRYLKARFTKRLQNQSITVIDVHPRRGAPASGYGDDDATSGGVIDITPRDADAASDSGEPARAFQGADGGPNHA